LNEALNRALKEHYERTCTKGLRAHRSTINQVSDELGATPLADLTTAVLMHYVEQLRGQGLTGGTINRRLAYISKALKLANMWGWLTSLPHVPRQKEAPPRHRELTPKEEDQVRHLLVRHPRYHWASGLVTFLLYTGARIGEVMAMSEVDRERALQAGHWTIWVNKGDRPRSVPLNAQARQALTTWAWQEHSYKQAEKAWAWVRGQLYLNEDKGFTLHSLRHTCASRLVQAGVPVLTVKEILGHASVSVTERYAQVAPANLTSAMDAL